MSRLEHRAVIGALVFVVLAIVVGLMWESSPRQISDINLYRGYGDRIVSGQVPYRDFNVEYPPGALVVFALPALVSTERTGFGLTLVAFLAVLGGVAVLVTDLILARLGRSRGVRHLTSLLLALSPIPLGALLVSRFDLLPALLVSGVVLALVSQRFRLTGVLLGVAISVKLYPGLFLPLAMATAWRAAGRRAAVEIATLSLGLTALAYLPFFLIAPGGVVHSIAHQASRPLQIESLGSSLLLALHHVVGLDLTWSSGHGSQNLDGSIASTLAMVGSLALLATVAFVCVRYVRVAPDSEALVVAVLAALLGFVVLGKVFSPQYLIWLLFLVPLVGGVVGRRVALLFGGACVLTLWWFPARYWRLVKEFDPFASWALVARNLALVVALALLVRALSSRARALRASTLPSG